MSYHILSYQTTSQMINSYTFSYHLSLKLQHIFSFFIYTFSTKGFVQKHVYGTDITVAFAAYKGELTGCVRMMKESYTDVGKVWDGRITPVSKSMTDALEEFVKDCNWTGGTVTITIIHNYYLSL